MGMLQLGSKQDLPLESINADTRQQLRRQHLDHHVTVKGALGCKVGAGHATAAELPLNDVRSLESALEPGEQIIHEERNREADLGRHDEPDARMLPFGARDRHQTSPRQLPGSPFQQWFDRRGCRTTFLVHEDPPPRLGRP
jgi:hypothetical protein